MMPDVLSAAIKDVQEMTAFRNWQYMATSLENDFQVDQKRRVTGLAGSGSLRRGRWPAEMML